MARGIKVFYAATTSALPSADMQENDYCIIKSDEAGASPRTISGATAEAITESDIYQSKVYKYNGTSWVAVTNFAFTDESLIANVTKVRRAHMDDFRSLIKAMQDVKASRFGDTYYNTHNFTNSVLSWGRDDDAAKLYLSDNGADSQWLTFEFGNNRADKIRFMYRSGATLDPVFDIEGDQLISAKPVFVPTADAATNNTQVATTAYVTTAIGNLIDGAPGALNTLNEIAAALADDANYSGTIVTQLGLKAPLESPALTGIPTAPTPVAIDNSTAIATTEFVKGQLPTLGGLGGEPAGTAAAAIDAHKIITTGVHGLDGKAPLDSPALTGTPTAPTAASAVSNTQIATTGFVHSVIASSNMFIAPWSNVGTYKIGDVVIILGVLMFKSLQDNNMSTDFTVTSTDWECLNRYTQITSMFFDKIVKFDFDITLIVAGYGGGGGGGYAGYQGGNGTGGGGAGLFSDEIILLKNYYYHIDIGAGGSAGDHGALTPPTSGGSTKIIRSDEHSTIGNPVNPVIVFEALGGEGGQCAHNMAQNGSGSVGTGLSQYISTGGDGGNQATGGAGHTYSRDTDLFIGTYLDIPPLSENISYGHTFPASLYAGGWGAGGGGGFNGIGGAAWGAGNMNGAVGSGAGGGSMADTNTISGSGGSGGLYIIY